MKRLFAVSRIPNIVNEKTIQRKFKRKKNVI